MKGTDHQDIENVILTVLQGEASTYQIEAFRKWLGADEQNRILYESIKAYWEGSRFEVSSAEIEGAYGRLKAMVESKPKERVLNTFDPKPAFAKNWYKVAAVLAFFISFAGLVYYISVSEVGSSQVVLSTKQVKENPKGQKLTTYLPDGSKVILNSQSRISYSSPFTGGHRLIELEGEAFFEVKKDPARPFIVTSRNVTTVALGTSFNVNSKNPEAVEVMLVTGKVKVSKSADDYVILEPGHSAISNEGEGITVGEFDYLDKVGWKDGVLAFKNNSMAEIIRKLEDWYGVDIMVRGELANSFHYTGTYKNETLEEVLYGISFVHDFDFKIDENTLEIFVKPKVDSQ
jgi:ferric-dicitrate binding protein FerR (iron transport regulator)